MLKGIPAILSPELLKCLNEMGHGDELLLADAHFPGASVGRRTLRADGLRITALLDAILSLVELDGPSPPLTMMQTDTAEEMDLSLEHGYMRVVLRHAPGTAAPMRVSRADFYQQARNAFAVLVTGDVRAYGNLLLRKGVTPAQPLE